MFAKVGELIKDHDNGAAVGHCVGTDCSNPYSGNLVVVNAGDSNIPRWSFRSSDPNDIVTTDTTIGTSIDESFQEAFQKTGGDTVSDGAHGSRRRIIVIVRVPSVHLIDVAFDAPFVIGILL